MARAACGRMSSSTDRIMSKPSKKPAATPEPAKDSSLKLVFLGWYGVIGMTLGYVSPIKLPWADGYAKDYWRHALGSLVLVLMLIAGGIGLAFYLLDVNDFKAQIVDYVKTHQQRDLVIEGDIHLNYFPKLGLDTGKMSLSQRNSGRKFASVDNARLYVSWWPLFTKQVQVERIVLDGLHANLVRHKDGSTNFDDLLVPADWMGEVQFEIEKIRVLDSSLNFQDEASGLALFLQGLNLESGRLADATAGQVNTSFRLQSMQPQLDLQLRLGGHVLYDHAGKRYQVADMEGHAQGEAGGLSDLTLDWQGSLTTWPSEHKLLLERVNAAAHGRAENDKIEGKLSATRVQLEKNLWQASVVSLGANVQREQDTLATTLEMPAFEADAKNWRSANVQAGLDLKRGDATLQGRLNSPLNYDVENRVLQLDALSGTWSASHPLLAARLNASSSGKLQARLASQDVALDIKASIDDSQFNGKVQLQDFKVPVWNVDLAVNTLDLDRHLVADWPRRLQESTEAQNFNLLKTLNLRGRLRADELRAARLKASQFSAELRAGAGTLSVEPIDARLYGGALQGSLALGAGDAPQLGMHQKLTGVQLDALLADLLGNEARITGKGNLAFDLTAQGASLEALRQSLTGTASVALTRGAVAGINLAEGLAAGREQLGLDGAVRSDTLRLTESTPYAELKASWDLAQGQARSADFVFKSPHISGKGEGSMALDSGLLDVWLSATVTPGLKRASAGELAELSGISIPLRISGPWATAAVRYELDAASGGNLARLAKANQARVAAAAAPAVAASAPTMKTATTASAGKPVAR